MVPTYEALLFKSQVYRAMNSYVTTTLRPFNLSPPEWGLLGILMKKGSIQPTELAQYLGVKPPVVASLLRRLELKKIITRTQHRVDNRFTTVALTQKGRDVIKRAEDKMQHDLSTFAKGVKSSSMNAYFEVLKEIAVKLNDKLQDI
jgi:DNA-binding MarR family transcriptional regulator